MPQAFHMLMGALWVLLFIGVAITFFVKYGGSGTGILGGLGSLWQAAVSLAYIVLPQMMSRGMRHVDMGMVYGVLNVMSFLAAACVFVAILLAPGRPQQQQMYQVPMQPWQPPQQQPPLV